MTTSTRSHNPSHEELLLPILEKLEKKDFELPPLSRVSSQVLKLISDPHAQASHFSHIIQQDQILTAKVFQAANSPALGSRYPVTSLSQAIGWLGINHIAGTAFALSLQSGVFNDVGYEKEVKGLWIHSLATGFYAKSIAGAIGQNQDSAFLCGLLHAIGKAFIVHTVNQDWQDSNPRLSWTVLTTLMNESYIELGRHLAEAWQFPDAVKEAIVLHADHTYHLATSSTKGAVITCLAKHLASHFLDPQGIQEEAIRELSVVHFLRMSQDDLSTLFDLRDLIQTQVDMMLV